VLDIGANIGAVTMFWGCRPSGHHVSCLRAQSPVLQNAL
jgi:hypothetical protein